MSEEKFNREIPAMTMKIDGLPACRLFFLRYAVMARICGRDRNKCRGMLGDGMNPNFS